MNAREGRKGGGGEERSGGLAAAVTSSFMNSLYFCSVQNKRTFLLKKMEKKAKNDHASRLFLSPLRRRQQQQQQRPGSRETAGVSGKLPPLRFLSKMSARVSGSRKKARTQVCIHDRDNFAKPCKKGRRREESAL